MASVSAHESTLSVDVDLDPEHWVTVVLVPGLSKFIWDAMLRACGIQVVGNHSASNDHLCWVQLRWTCSGRQTSRN